MPTPTQLSLPHAMPEEGLTLTLDGKRALQETRVSSCSRLRPAAPGARGPSPSRFSQDPRAGGLALATRGLTRSCSSCGGLGSRGPASAGLRVWPGLQRLCRKEPGLVQTRLAFAPGFWEVISVTPDRSVFA